MNDNDIAHSEKFELMLLEALGFSKDDHITEININIQPQCLITVSTKQFVQSSDFVNMVNILKDYKLVNKDGTEIKHELVDDSIPSASATIN